MATRDKAQAAKDSRNYRARHRATLAERYHAKHAADPGRWALHARNYRARKRARRLAARDAAARWRAANPGRAAEHCRAYYSRKKMQDPGLLAAWNLDALRRCAAAIFGDASHA